MNKHNFLRIFFLGFAFFASYQQVLSQVSANPTLLDKANPWSQKQLLQPAELAAKLNSSKGAKPVIFNIGVVENIKNAKKIGAAREEANLAKFKQELSKLPKNSMVVVYCGCCPFDKCPNIRPAMKLLNDSKFTNAFLLNLPTNLKTDWVNKGYPLAK